jgi:SAM-dependent methyltransferase
MTQIPEDMQKTRRTLAARFLAGQGIEIGALDCPLPLPGTARVKYVDRVSVAELRRYYPELAQRALTEPDVIEDGEKLPAFEPQSLDFIIANHMLEHCENPLGTLRVHLDRVRRGGVLFYSIPDKRQCFDLDRPLTRFDHLVADDADGGNGSRWQHYLEWAKHVNAIAAPEAAEHNARENMKNAYSIHFHVWDPDSWRGFLDAAGGYLGIDFAVEHFQTSGTEIISILRRN